ncbi:Ribonuclease H domain - like 10 [Theobroma cacao]|nr:Ribonuclease H domain - like 10 [Theobroma cacao]
MEFEFLDEDLMSICQTSGEKSGKKNWKMFFDGASNALGHGIGVLLVSPEGDHYPVIAKLNFYCTNNVAEYEACVMGLQVAIERKIHILEVFEDSALTRDSKLVRYHKYVSTLIENFDKICFTYLPREENQMAYALATLAAMFKVGTNVKIQPIMINLRECPTHCFSVEEEIDGKPWYHDIVHYLKFQQYPDQSSENDKKTIRRLAMNFFLDGNILYKRSRDQMLLRCVDSAEARRIVKKVHERICGTHASGHKLARQVMRAGYYWLTLETDCIDFARKCHKCQIYADRIHILANSLHVLTSPWPFSMWGMDVIGLITPKASNGHRFILVAIDYFSRWVEAASYANVT